MSEQCIGSSIYHSVALVEKVGREVDSLLDLVKQQLEAKVHALKPLMKITEGWDSDDRTDDSGWVYTDQVEYIGIGKREGSSKLFVNIQVSLAGDGMTSEEGENEVPLIHVSLWECGSCFEEDTYHSIINLREEEVTLQDGILVNWAPDAERWEDQVWTYSLELTSINSLADIKVKIIEPFSSLVQGFGVDGSGLKNIEGIVSYEKASSGNYRVRSK